jgi:lipid-A-disaccharide synthase
MRIGICAGEASGDILAAGLIKELLKTYPHAQIEGIAGPLMIEAGCKALYPSEKLSVMGLVEILSHFRELSQIRSELIKHFIQHPPDVFIGVDAPDFNLGVEAALKNKGIGTIHYVSPSVWAWRQYRIAKISRAVDLMLTLFPFEARFYENHNIAVKYVGHTLADEIPLKIDKRQARIKLGLETVIPEPGLTDTSADVDADYRPIIAVLPGSRGSEVSRLARPFIETMALCQRRRPELRFLVPLVNRKIRSMFEEELLHCDDRPELQLFDGQSKDVMEAADAVLLASGTATLEAMLLKKPMLVAYKVAPVTFWIARKLVKLPYFSLPNLLAGEHLVEEITQNQVTAELLAPKVLNLLVDKSWEENLSIFEDIHILLQQNASQTAAQAVIDYLIEKTK